MISYISKNVPEQFISTYTVRSTRTGNNIFHMVLIDNLYPKLVASLFPDNLIFFYNRRS